MAGRPARASVPGDRLGVPLFQIPPGLHADVRRLADFLDLLPDDAPHAFEMRHRSWFERGVCMLLARKGAAFVVHDCSRRGRPIVETTPFVYLRLHGATGRYRGAHDAAALLRWSQQARGWLARGFRAWGYLNNDEKSVRNALDLAAMAGVEPQKMFQSAGTNPPHVSSRA